MSADLERKIRADQYSCAYIPMQNRLTATRCLGALVASLTLLAAVPATAQAEAEREPLVASATSVVAEINSARRAHGLRALRVSPGLGKAARVHARSMLRGGYFSHGSTTARVRRYYAGSTIGEAILWRSPSLGAAQGVSMWLGSSPHRRILLSGRFRDVGVGVVHGYAGGAFGGRQVTIVVADFGAS